MAWERKLMCMMQIDSLNKNTCDIPDFAGFRSLPIHQGKKMLLIGSWEEEEAYTNLGMGNSIHIYQ